MAKQTFQETIEAQLGQLSYRCAALGQTILDLREENEQLKRQLLAPNTTTNGGAEGTVVTKELHG